MKIVLLFLLEFFVGSLMFSYWLGLKFKKDLKQIGDGNPGAFNLWSSSGAKVGMLGVILDFVKGYFPLVFLLPYINGYSLTAVAIAPVLGTAFSPFMKFKGGKATAVTFGVWSAVTAFRVSILYALILAFFSLFALLIKHGIPASSDADGFNVVLGMVIVLVFLCFMNYSNYIIALCILNLIVITYKNFYKLVRRK